MTSVFLETPKRLVDVEIDGVSVRVPEGATLLDACRVQGIDTPTLCYLENLTPVNVCRVCVVEVEGSRTLVPSCSRKAEPGMKVHTDSERVRTSRKMVLEFLASSVDLSLASADVQRWIAEYGVDQDRYGPPAPDHPAGERDAARAGEHHADTGHRGGDGRPAGQGRQRGLRPRLLPLHPLLQVRGGLRRGRAEHVRDRGRGPRLRRADLDRVRRDPSGLRLRVLRQLHRRLPDRRAHAGFASTTCARRARGTSPRRP